jgi:hypothetical protein
MKHRCRLAGRLRGPCAHADRRVAALMPSGPGERSCTDSWPRDNRPASAASSAQPLTRRTTDDLLRKKAARFCSLMTGVALASAALPRDGVTPRGAAETVRVSVQTHYRTLRHLGCSTVADLHRCRQRNLGDKPLLGCRTLRHLGCSTAADLRRCRQRNPGDKPLLECRTPRHLGCSTVADLRRCRQRNPGDMPLLVCRTHRRLADSSFDHMGQRKPRTQDHTQ